MKLRAHLRAFIIGLSIMQVINIVVVAAATSL